MPCSSSSTQSYAVAGDCKPLDGAPFRCTHCFPRTRLSTLPETLSATLHSLAVCAMQLPRVRCDLSCRNQTTFPNFVLCFWHAVGILASFFVVAVYGDPVTSCIMFHFLTITHGRSKTSLSAKKKSLLACSEGGDRAFHRARDVCVIQKCIQVFSQAESGVEKKKSGVGRLQRSVDADSKQSGHQRIPLFSTLRLGNDVGVAALQVLTASSIEHADERDEGRQSWAIAEALEHLGTCNSRKCGRRLQPRQH